MNGSYDRFDPLTFLSNYMTPGEMREMVHMPSDDDKIKFGTTSHYNQYFGFEVIDVCEQLRDPDGGGNFNRGNAFKYLARAGWKDPQDHVKHIEDLKKARNYIEREIKRVADAAAEKAAQSLRSKLDEQVDKALYNVETRTPTLEYREPKHRSVNDDILYQYQHGLIGLEEAWRMRGEFFGLPWVKPTIDDMRDLYETIILPNLTTLPPENHIAGYRTDPTKPTTDHPAARSCYDCGSPGTIQDPIAPGPGGSNWRCENSKVCFARRFPSSFPGIADTMLDSLKKEYRFVTNMNPADPDPDWQRVFFIQKENTGQWLAEGPDSSGLLGRRRYQLHPSPVLPKQPPVYECAVCCTVLQRLTALEKELYVCPYGHGATSVSLDGVAKWNLRRTDFSCPVCNDTLASRGHDTILVCPSDHGQLDIIDVVTETGVPPVWKKLEGEVATLSCKYCGRSGVTLVNAERSDEWQCAGMDHESCLTTQTAQVEAYETQVSPKVCHCGATKKCVDLPGSPFSTAEYICERGHRSKERKMESVEPETHTCHFCERTHSTMAQSDRGADIWICVDEEYDECERLKAEKDQKAEGLELRKIANNFRDHFCKQCGVEMELGDWTTGDDGQSTQVLRCPDGHTVRFPESQ